MSQREWNRTLIRTIDDGLAAMLEQLEWVVVSGDLLVKLDEVFEIGMRVNAAATELRNRDNQASS